MNSRVDDGRRTLLKCTVAGALAVGAAAALRPTNLRAEEDGRIQAGGARREGYRIAKAEAIALPIPLRHPFKMAKATITHSNHVYVRLEDESGRVAWGETFNVPGIYARGYRTIYNDLTDHLLPAVIGMDPFEIGRLHVAMDKALPLCRDGKSGVDLAAYDLAGKQFGVPVSTLLGGRLVDEVPMIGTISIVPPTEAAEKAKALVADGYKFLKLKFGISWKDDVERLNAVRAAVGPDIEVKCDANASYNREDALKALHGVRDAGLQHFEQPLAQHDIEGAAYLAQRTSIPICGDESLQTLRDAFNILKRDAASAMVLKLMKNGGMYRSQQIVAMCSAIGVPCYLSSGTDLSLGTSALLHCYASTPGFAGALETADLLADDVAKSPLVRGPSMQVPTGAGLGVDLDEQKIEKYRKKLR